MHFSLFNEKVRKLTAYLFNSKESLEDNKVRSVSSAFDLRLGVEPTILSKGAGGAELLWKARKRTHFFPFIGVLGPRMTEPILIVKLGNFSGNIEADDDF